jgi:hypothetical protein
MGFCDTIWAEVAPLREAILAHPFLTGLADAGLLVPASADGIVVHPWPGDPGHNRVVVDHPDGPCQFTRTIGGVRPLAQGLQGAHGVTFI